jgi:hypothetical protein
MRPISEGNRSSVRRVDPGRRAPRASFHRPACGPSRPGRSLLSGALPANRHPSRRTSGLREERTPCIGGALPQCRGRSGRRSFPVSSSGKRPFALKCFLLLDPKRQGDQNWEFAPPRRCDSRNRGGPGGGASIPPTAEGGRGPRCRTIPRPPPWWGREASAPSLARPPSPTRRRPPRMKATGRTAGTRRSSRSWRDRPDLRIGPDPRQPSKSRHRRAGRASGTADRRPGRWACVSRSAAPIRRQTTVSVISAPQPTTAGFRARAIGIPRSWRPDIPEGDTSRPTPLIAATMGGTSHRSIPWSG